MSSVTCIHTPHTTTHSTTNHQNYAHLSFEHERKHHCARVCERDIAFLHQVDGLSYRCVRWSAAGLDPVSLTAAAVTVIASKRGVYTMQLCHMRAITR
jgi:hypothetical protein